MESTINQSKKKMCKIENRIIIISLFSFFVLVSNFVFGVKKNGVSIELDEKKNLFGVLMRARAHVHR